MGDKSRAKKTMIKAGVPVIEDSAQAYLAATPLGLVGSIGDYGAFSLQQGKHITCGEGGFVLSNDADTADAVRTFALAWPAPTPPARPRPALATRCSRTAARSRSRTRPR